MNNLLINTLVNCYGKETIDTNTYSKSSGKGGSYSTNFQQSGRELLTPDEVRLLDNKYALLFIRGERAIKDLKYDILKHPNIDLTADGKSPIYEHGTINSAMSSIEVLREKKLKKEEIENIPQEEIDSGYIVLTSDEVEEYLKKEKENDEKQVNEQIQEIYEEGEDEYEE